MVSPHCVPRRPRRPLLLPLLLTWCLLQLTGTSAEDRPVLCERNVCKNDGICYKMKTAIAYDWSPPITTTWPSSTPWQPTTEPTREPTTTAFPWSPTSTPESTTSHAPTSDTYSSTTSTMPSPVPTDPSTTASSTASTTPSPVPTDPSTTASSTASTTPSPVPTDPSTNTPSYDTSTPGTTGTGDMGLHLELLAKTTPAVPPPLVDSDFLLKLEEAEEEKEEGTTPPPVPRRLPRALPKLLSAELPPRWEIRSKEEEEEEEGLGDAPPQLQSGVQSSTEQTCHCDERYEGEDCSRQQGDGNKEIAFFRETKIGDDTNHVIVDFGVLGRLPKGTTTECNSPDVQLPANSDGCIAPSSEAILRYWCQGKMACVPNIEFLSVFEPDSCLFGSGYNVSSCVYLRYRHGSPGSVTLCREGGTYDPETQTCYVLTASLDGWNEQRALCRALGGDLTYLPSSVTYPGFRDFLRQITAKADRNITAVWVAGNSTGPRPVLDMRGSVVQDGAELCFELDTEYEQRCYGAGILYAVCALPPWPEDVTPDCPAVTFQQYGLTFPETAPDHTVSQPCGDGYTGIASYVCGLDGQWSTELPDLSRCHSETIDTDDVQLRLENGTEHVSDIISELTANVSQSSSQGKPLTAGDVISSVQLLPQMVQAQKAQLDSLPEQAQQAAQQYVDNVTNLVSELTRQESSWQTMPRTNRSQTATTLQSNMEQSSYLLTDYLQDEHEDFDHDTIRVRAGRFSSLAGNLEYVTRQGSSVKLPKEVRRFSKDGNTSIVFVEYANLDCLLSGQKCRTAEEWRQQTDLQYRAFVNSPVLSATVDNRSVSLIDSNVTLRFSTRLSAAQFNLSGAQCVFWNTSANMWSDYGCHVVMVTNSSVECQCNHLTSFATLMDINGVIEEGSLLDLALSWLTTIGCIISLLSLAACLVVFTVIPTLRSELISVHRNLCLSLFAAEFILLVGLEPHGNAAGCAVVAVLLHFWFLAAFTWMCIEGIKVCILVKRVFATRTSFMRYYYGCGYGVPALIVVISLSVTKGEGYGTETACWLSTENGLIWAFAGPVMVVVLVNIVALVLALQVKAQASRASRQPAVQVEPAGRRQTDSRSSDGRMVATLVRGSASLVAILGTTWLFGFLYFSNGLVFFSVVFTLLNSLQGFFIFFFLIWLNDKNHREARLFMLRTMYRVGLTDQDPLSSSSGVTPHSRSGQTESSESESGATWPERAAGVGHRLVRALRRGNVGHYSMNQGVDESNSTGSANTLILRRMGSSQSDSFDA